MASVFELDIVQGVVSGGDEPNGVFIDTYGSTLEPGDDPCTKIGPPTRPRVTAKGYTFEDGLVMIEHRIGGKIFFSISQP